MHQVFVKSVYNSIAIMFSLGGLIHIIRINPPPHSTQVSGKIGRMWRKYFDQETVLISVPFVSSHLFFPFNKVSNLTFLFIPFSEWCYWKWFSKSVSGWGETEGNVPQERKAYPTSWWSSFTKMYRNRITASNHHMDFGFSSNTWNTPYSIWRLCQVRQISFYFVNSVSGSICQH